MIPRIRFIKSSLVVLSVLLLGNAAVAATPVDMLAPVCVYLQEKPDSGYKYGSGFFVKNNNDLFLVTASHVASFMTLDSKITIAKKDGSPASFQLRDFIPNAEEVEWIVHDHADVAVLLLSPSQQFINTNLAGHFLPISYIDDNESAPDREVTITVVGFPKHLGLQHYFSPISKDTQPASGLLELKRADNSQASVFYILQDQSVGGFSGGPVFDRNLPRADQGGIVIVSGNARLVGLVHGTIRDDTGGSFAAIVPSFLIRATIEKATKSQPTETLN